MVSRFGDGRGGRVVPLQVAQQLLNQRDQLVAEVQSARREKDQLESKLQTAQRECEALEDRAASAEEEARALRQKIAEMQQEEGPPSDAVREARGDETIALLDSRIKKLTQDLERLRRRTSETVDTARREERVRLLSGLGDVLDSVERALSIDEVDSPWRQGLEGIQSQLHAFLRGEGASIVGTEGEKMDPNIHQAIATVDDSDFASGEIARVDRVGIVLDDDARTVVRPAQVVVAK